MPPLPLHLSGERADTAAAKGTGEKRCGQRSSGSSSGGPLLHLHLLVEQLSEQPRLIVEPGLGFLHKALTPLPATLCEEFEKRLVNMTEPDDLWTLMSSLSELLQPPLALDDCAVPTQIERSSVCRHC